MFVFVVVVVFVFVVVVAVLVCVSIVGISHVTDVVSCHSFPSPNVVLLLLLLPIVPGSCILSRLLRRWFPVALKCISIILYAQPLTVFTFYVSVGSAQPCLLCYYFWCVPFLFLSCFSWVFAHSCGVAVRVKVSPKFGSINPFD